MYMKDEALTFQDEKAKTNADRSDNLAQAYIFHQTVGPRDHHALHRNVLHQICV